MGAEPVSAKDLLHAVELAHCRSENAALRRRVAQTEGEKVLSWSCLASNARVKRYPSCHRVSGGQCPRCNSRTMHHSRHANRCGLSVRNVLQCCVMCHIEQCVACNCSQVLTCTFRACVGCSDVPSLLLHRRTPSRSWLPARRRWRRARTGRHTPKR